MDDKERAMELYKLEYEKAAERYDNIYRSIWTIFSYLTAVAAGFLAFGKDKIEPHALICMAASPLLFWFWTTYMPLDRYGNEVIKRLGEIECTLNADFQVNLNHFKPYAEKELSVVKALLELKRGSHPFEQVRRARFAIGVIFIALHCVFISELIGFCHSGQRLFL
jgi:hypothetical protein